MRLGRMTLKKLLRTDYKGHKTVVFCGFLNIQGPISRFECSVIFPFKCRQYMRSGHQMTLKQLLKTNYKVQKTVAFCGFLKIQSPILRIDCSITFLFKCRQ